VTSSIPSTAIEPSATSSLRPGARRLLLLGGIGLILAGMIFGDIFAVFVLHQNAAHVGSGLSAAAHAALRGDSATVSASFADVGSFLENRGTKVDVHVHMIDFGYLALLLALVQPWVAYDENRKRQLARLFLVGSLVLPIGVFLIHYVGVAYSPVRAIGWASIFADLGGACVLVATAAFLFGIFRTVVAKRQPAPDALLAASTNAATRLLAGGVILILLGFGHGAYYAASDLYRHEDQDYSILSSMATAAAVQNVDQVDRSLTEYGQLQADKAVKIAAHAHIIEFGLLAMILGFFQPYVNLSERWKQRCIWTLLLGSTLLPICVLLELQFGLLAGGIADTGGLLVIVALSGMWIGIVRYTGALDAAAGTQS
jgi:hypothetical protein